MNKSDFWKRLCEEAKKELDKELQERMKNSLDPSDWVEYKKCKKLVDHKKRRRQH